MRNTIRLGVSALLVVATTLAIAQAPAKPDTSDHITSDKYPFTWGYFHFRYRVTEHTRTFVLAEFKSVCDATCAACNCTEFKQACPGPRDGGKDSKGHSQTYKGDALLEQVSTSAASVGAEGQGAKGSYSVTGSTTGKLTASTEIMLGFENTHAAPGEKLQFYGYIAATITWQTTEWHGATEWFDSTETTITNITIEVANGYDKIPCHCGLKYQHSMRTQDPGSTFSGNCALASVTVSTEQTVSIINPFPTAVAMVRVVGDPDTKQEIKPGEAVSLKGSSSDLLIGTAVGVLALVTSSNHEGKPQFCDTPPNLHIPGSSVTPANPPVATGLGKPNLKSVSCGSNTLQSVPVYGDKTTPWMKVDGSMPQGCELRLKTALKDGTSTVHVPSTIVIVSEPGGTVTNTVPGVDSIGNVTEKTVKTEWRQTVSSVVKFQDLPNPSEISGMSLMVVNANGKSVAEMKLQVKDASMHVKLNPQVGRPGTSVNIEVNATDYLMSLQMEYPQFDASKYQLKIDYSASGGVTGPEYCELGQNGIATVAATRGNVPGSFPIAFQLVPKAGTDQSVRIYLAPNQVLVSDQAK